MISPDIILSEERLQETVDYFLTKDAFVFDIEAAGAHRDVAHLNNLTWMSMATYGRAVVIPFGHPIGSNIIGTRKVPTEYKSGSKAGQTYNRNIPIYDEPPKQLDRGIVFDILRRLFFNRRITKIAHNSTFDLASVAKYFGEVPPGPYDDTIVLAWLTDENRMRLGLKYLIKEMYGYTYDDEEVGRCIEKYPFDKVALYSYQDSRMAWLMYRDLLPLIADMDLEQVHEIETALIPALVDMRLTGAHVDIEELERQKANLSVRLEEIRGRAWKAAGTPFNLASVPQKQKLLFSPKPEGQGLKPWKLTKSGANSTDDSVLKSYPNNLLARTILEFQETSKILGTYIIGYLGEYNDKDPEKSKPCRIYDGNIHADFVQYGTVTGRFSCREPNLQNIPRPDTDLGKIIRGLWISRPGSKLIVADFGQIELVILAHYLGEGKLYDGFHAGIDPHRMTAAAVLGKRPEDVTKDERQYLGKTLGFAVVYGAGIEKIAAMADVPVKRAREILAEHRRQFPEIYTYRNYLLEKCRSAVPVPHIRTLSDRIRRIPHIVSPDEGMRMLAERQCFNSLIQGSAADIQKLAMIDVHNDPRRGDSIKMLMTVHDEIMLTAPDDKAELAADILREAMTGPKIQSLLTVPLKADVNIATRWSDAK